MSLIDFAKQYSIDIATIYWIFGGKDFINSHQLHFSHLITQDWSHVLRMRSRGNWTQNHICIVYILSFKKKSLCIDWFYLPLSLQKKGILTSCLKSLQNVAKILNFRSIATKAHRDDSSTPPAIGYYVRPLLGFNGLHNSKKLQNFCTKHQLPPTQDIQWLYTLEKWKELRKLHGRTFASLLKIL